MSEFKLIRRELKNGEVYFVVTHRGLDYISFRDETEARQKFPYYRDMEKRIHEICDGMQVKEEVEIA